MEMKQHPLSAAFPSMSADEFQALKDDIDNNGQREPVICLDGMVLDGWHRYRACTELGMKVTQFAYGGGDPVAFVLSQNMHRRHLTASQRAAAVAACSAWAPAHRPTKLDSAATSPNNQAVNKGAAAAPLLTNQEMAKAANVSVRTIKDAKAAHQAGLGDAVKDGSLTAEQAANIARGKTEKKAAPPPAPPALQAPQAPQDDGPTAEEIAASEREAAEELEALRKIAAADDKLAAALAETKQLRALNRVLTERNNGLINEKNELIKRIKSLQRRLEKLEQPA